MVVLHNFTLYDGTPHEQRARHGHQHARRCRRVTNLGRVEPGNAHHLHHDLLLGHASCVQLRLRLRLRLGCPLGLLPASPVLAAMATTPVVVAPAVIPAIVPAVVPTVVTAAAVAIMASAVSWVASAVVAAFTTAAAVTPAAVSM